MRTLLLIVVVALGAAVALPAAASARVVDVPSRLAKQLPRASDAGNPVLLPSRADLDVGASQRLFPGVRVDVAKERYVLSLHATRGCTANVCFLATFTGDRGAKLGYGSAPIDLALGQHGHYDRGGCGASCTPPSIAWVQKGVRYEIQAKALGGRKAFVRMANSAIRAGNRK